MRVSRLKKTDCFIFDNKFKKKKAGWLDGLHSMELKFDQAEKRIVENKNAFLHVIKISVK